MLPKTEAQLRSMAILAMSTTGVSPDHKNVYRLAEVDAPADIGLDRKRNLLYVPMLLKGQVAIYKLRHR